MSTYTRRIEAKLLSSGLTTGGLLGYKVVGIDDGILIPRTTSGISEDGTSSYYYANVSDWDTAWSGTIVWDAGAGTLAREPFLASQEPAAIPPVVIGPSPIPIVTGSYCSDENIASETNDFPSLVPPNQIDAYGTDGVIIQTNPWLLTSASADFVANAVQPASLVYLTKPEEIWGPDPGEVFAVASVDPLNVHNLTIRRIGRAPGQGEPPGYYNQDVVGIEFTIKTMLIQIQEATAEIDRRYGISEFLTNARADIVPADWQKINRMCVYLVLAKRYLSISRTTTAPGAMDVWLVKADRYRKLFDEEASSLTISTAAGQISAPNRKFTRLYRI